ncbi:ankyrin repeat-containing domain protein [Xylaria palmicola]|nr:ankyrin repeat-containing domain protein [Xylaria palmicola]
MVLDRADLSIVNGTGDTRPEILCRIVISTCRSANRVSENAASLKLSSALNYGASPDEISIQDNGWQWPVIVMAAYYEKYGMVDKLRQAGADILARETGGRDLTFYYIAHGRLDLLRGISKELETASYDWMRGVPLELREKSGNLVKWQGCTALHTATSVGSTELMDYLLQDGRCPNVDVTSKESRTPLHVASYMGNVEVIKYLVAHGASVNVIDNELNLPIDLAFMNGAEPAIESLRQLGSMKPIGETGGGLRLVKRAGKCHYVWI